MKKNLLLLAFTLASAFVNAQATVLWSENSPGPSNYENRTIATDSQGNVYSTGTYTSPQDFDPGPGVFTMTCFQTNMFILKLDAAGNFVWAKQIGGGAAVSYSQGNAITIDASDNVYIAGTATGFFGPIDFDPGDGVYNLTTPLGEADIFIEKLDSNGNFVWVKQIRNPTDTTYGLDSVQSIKADASGNVYATGGFGGTADFDPGAGTYNLTSVGGTLSTNIFILKLSASGDFVWARALNNSGLTNDSHTDKGYAIDVDTAGNVYTTGYYWGGIDADPGAGMHNLVAYTSDNPTISGSNCQYFSKLDANGNFVWAYDIPGDHNLQFHPTLAVDALNNVIVGGFMQDNIPNLIDYDFGPGTYHLPVQTGAYILKMDGDANFIWAKSTAELTTGSNAQSWCTSLAVDGAGNVYSSGTIYNGIYDMDPGAGSLLLTPDSVDIFVSKLDTNGNLVWANKLGGSGIETAYSIAVSPSGKVNVSGSAGTGGLARTATVAAGGFIASLTQPGLATSREELSNNIAVFPNPSNGDFKINVDTSLIGTQVTAYNMLGQQAATFELELLPQLRILVQECIYWNSIRMAL